MTEKLYDNMDNKSVSLVILCDLSKAFDSVNHEILLQKFLQLKIDTFWFENYLEGRTQSVRIGQTLSSTKKVSFGVPQGSVLGPYMYIIHINDMIKFVKNCLLVIYADDAQVIFTGKVNDIPELIKRAEETLKKS